jgi:hypothetical protein
MVCQAFLCQLCRSCCSKIAEAEAAVSVNEKKLLVMHVHVQLRLDESQLQARAGRAVCTYLCVLVEGQQGTGIVQFVDSEVSILQGCIILSCTVNICTRATSSASPYDASR